MKKTFFPIRAFFLCLCAALILPSCAQDSTQTVYIPQSEPTESESRSESETEPPTERAEPTSDYSSSGFFESDTGTDLLLRIEWQARQNPDAYKVDIAVKVFLEYKGTFSVGETTGNLLTVGDEHRNFAVEAMDEYTEDFSPVLLYSYNTQVDRPDGEDINIRLLAKYRYNGYYDGYFFRSVIAQGNIFVSDKYDTMKSSADIDVPLIKQYPELPNGCEVTSLAMTLNYLGYGISKTDLKNDYLPIGQGDFYSYNIGDPASSASFGCYSPVIVKTAERYFADNNISREVGDLTHCNVEELFYNISEGRPVIVWITQNLSVKPSIISSWRLGGLTFNWKAPLHCVVLTGYDLDAGTVTVTDPIYGVVTHEKELFERRWHEMGEQAVVIK